MFAAGNILRDEKAEQFSVEFIRLHHDALKE
jgi:hypothetical protein